MWTAIGGLVSSHINTNIQVIRREIALELNTKQQKIHDSSFKEAVSVCYAVVFDAILAEVLRLVRSGKGVFVVMKNASEQKRLSESLAIKGIDRIHSITSKTPINYTPKSKKKLDVIITTIKYDTGYSITGLYTMVTSVYFSNQSTRTQLDARINRIGQINKYVEYITIHCGLLTYVMNRYDKIRSEADALKGFGNMVECSKQQCNI